MKKVREVFEIFEPWCQDYATYTKEVKRFLTENGFDNDYRSYTVDEIARKCIYGNRYRGLFVADEIMFMAEYTVNEWHNGKPMCYEDVEDIEFPEDIILPFSEWDTKGLSPEEYILNEIRKYRTITTEESDCVYHISSGHDGDLDLSFVVLFDKKKDKYCGVKFAHFPVWSTGNELRIEYIKE